MTWQEQDIITEHGQAFVQQITVWRMTCLICGQWWSKERWSRRDVAEFMKDHEYQCQAIANGEWEE